MMLHSAIPNVYCWVHVLCDNESFLDAAPCAKAHMLKRIKLWHIPPRSPDLNPVEAGVGASEEEAQGHGLGRCRGAEAVVGEDGLQAACAPFGAISQLPAHRCECRYGVEEDVQGGPSQARCRGGPLSKVPTFSVRRNRTGTAPEHPLSRESGSTRNNPGEVDG